MYAMKDHLLHQDHHIFTVPLHEWQLKKLSEMTRWINTNRDHIRKCRQLSREHLQAHVSDIRRFGTIIRPHRQHNRTPVEINTPSQHPSAKTLRQSLIAPLQMFESNDDDNNSTSSSHENSDDSEQVLSTPLQPTLHAIWNLTRPQHQATPEDSVVYKTQSVRGTVTNKVINALPLTMPDKNIDHNSNSENETKYSSHDSMTRTNNNYFSLSGNPSNTIRPKAISPKKRNENTSQSSPTRHSPFTRKPSQAMKIRQKTSDTTKDIIKNAGDIPIEKNKYNNNDTTCKNKNEGIINEKKVQHTYVQKPGQGSDTYVQVTKQRPDTNTKNTRKENSDKYRDFTATLSQTATTPLHVQTTHVSTTTNTKIPVQTNPDPTKPTRHEDDTSTRANKTNGINKNATQQPQDKNPSKLNNSGNSRNTEAVGMKKYFNRLWTKIKYKHSTSEK